MSTRSDASDSGAEDDDAYAELDRLDAHHALAHLHSADAHALLSALHDDAVSEDPQLRAYVAMLEAEYDRRARAALEGASGDDLAARFEEYLRDQRDD